jgi:hypothetical protein
MQILLSAFDDVPDPRASDARHDLGELLVISFVSALCGSASCAEMAACGHAKERLFKDFLKLKHAIPSRDTFSEIFRGIDPKALNVAFGKVHMSHGSLSMVVPVVVPWFANSWLIVDFHVGMTPFSVML